MTDHVTIAVPTVDTDEIAESVLAQVESRLAEQGTRVHVRYANATAAATAETLDDALIAVYQQANPAVVYIVVPSVGTGSGFGYNAES